MQGLLDALARLERYIDWQLLDRFHDGLSEVVNKSECGQARWTPPRTGETYDISGLTCRRDNPLGCRVDHFLGEHRSYLENVVRSLRQVAGQDEDLDKACETIEKVVTGSERPFGKNCYALADTIVALEAPHDAPIYTTNERHFRPLVQAIGKTLFPAP